MYSDCTYILERGVVTGVEGGTKLWSAANNNNAPLKPSKEEEERKLYDERLEKELADVQAMQNKNNFWLAREKQIKQEIAIRHEKENK
jgi:hypothetical protein